MNQDHTPHRPSFENEATFLNTSLGDGLVRAAPGPREAFVAAYGRIADIATLAERPAVIVVAVNREHRVVDTVLVEDGRSLILGRHTRCGLRLPAPAVALRHLALLVRSEGDRVVTHVWDLNTGAPFLTEAGERTAALIADGPVYVAIHGYAFWVIPAAMVAALPERAVAAWEALPRRAVIDRRPAEAAPHCTPVTLPVAEGAARPVAALGPTPLPPAPSSEELDGQAEACHVRIGPHVYGTQNSGRVPSAPLASTARPYPVDEISHVTLVGSPLLLGEPDEVEIGWGSVRLEHGGRRRRHPVSAERLDRGVLLGRYDRCGLEIAEGRVSRVHALLVKIEGNVWIIDTASTNGTFRGGAGIEATVLEDADTLNLGNVATLDWRRQKHAEA